MRRTATLLSFLACTVVSAQTRAKPSATIYRDAYGAPHVYAATDAGATFGMAWALAEDDWPLIEENYLSALGRAAEIRGDSALRMDWFARAMQIAKYSQAEYRASSPRLRALLDAYAAGLNGYLKATPNRKGPQILSRVEPWYPLALIRFKYYVVEFLGYAGLETSHWQRLMNSGWNGQRTALGDAIAPASTAPRDSTLWDDFYGPWGDRSFGSNEWAVAPARTKDGHAMLLINPHQRFVGVQRYGEIHLQSAQGMHFSGLTVFGFVLPYMGHNERLGWAYTDNYADHSDLYAETFSDSANPLRYRYGATTRMASTWTDTILVKRNGTLSPRGFRFWRTHHGPVVGVDNAGKPLAVKMARYEEGGWFAQWDEMIRARNLPQWKAAFSKLSVAYMNTMYADADGNIGYVYGSTVPKRLPGVNPQGILDGSDPKTEWQGFHAFSELPQIYNPKSGWLLNTNSTPFTATIDLPWSRASFPPYMVGTEIDNPRAVSSKRVLENAHDLTFDDFAKIVLDTRLSAADTLLPQLAAEWQKFQSATAGDLPESLRATAVQATIRGVVDRLAAWNRRADTGSVETTWFVFANERRLANGRPAANSWPWMQAIATMTSQLDAMYGRREVTWGEVNRLQRPLPNSAAVLDATRPSLPVRGAPGALGSVFVFNTDGFGSVRPRLGQQGNSFVKVIEFGPKVRARSMINYGQSGDPDSPHFFDQGALYSRGIFKDAWFSKADVQKHAVRSYTVK